MATKKAGTKTTEKADETMTESMEKATKAKKKAAPAEELPIDEVLLPTGEVVEPAAKKTKKRTKKDKEEAEAVPEKTNEEKLNELVEKGKAAGKLSSKELMDVLDDMNLEPDELDKFYDRLENLGIDLTGDNTLVPL